ncbi:YraN family protein [Staphylospora marina]|uniref:YraN family protein n=1 Tax=Staphylospora marina TaxID=2490858 RepID=UPI000F5C1CAC|nr:YraN family protein [Staphylospora marina]
MTDRRKATGRAGEEAAARFLSRKGLNILDRNWSSRLGELDLVAVDGDTLVFVEVRTTGGDRFGHGFQSVDLNKQRKVRRLAAQYLQMHRLHDRPVRFDVVSVRVDRNLEVLHVEHIPGAF